MSWLLLKTQGGYIKAQTFPETFPINCAAELNKSGIS